MVDVWLLLMLIIDRFVLKVLIVSVSVFVSISILERISLGAMMDIELRNNHLRKLITALFSSVNR